jgi:hypothetical protein
MKKFIFSWVWLGAFFPQAQAATQWDLSFNLPRHFSAETLQSRRSDQLKILDSKGHVVMRVKRYPKDGFQMDFVQGGGIHRYDSEKNEWLSLNDQASPSFWEESCGPEFALNNNITSYRSQSSDVVLTDGKWLYLLQRENFPEYRPAQDWILKSLRVRSPAKAITAFCQGE